MKLMTERIQDLEDERAKLLQRVKHLEDVIGIKEMEECGYIGGSIAFVEVEERVMGEQSMENRIEDIERQLGNFDGPRTVGERIRDLDDKTEKNTAQLKDIGDWDRAAEGRPLADTVQNQRAQTPLCLGGADSSRYAGSDRQRDCAVCIRTLLSTWADKEYA